MPAGKKYGGRKAGVKNKLTTSVKDALLAAMNAGDGAEAFWIGLKETEPRTFATIAGRLLPKEITGADGDPLIPEIMSFDRKVDICRRYAFLIAETDSELSESEGLKPTPRPYHQHGERK